MLRVTFPPRPSRAKARISLSFRAMMEFAERVILPPPPAPLKTEVKILLFPDKRIVFAAISILPPAVNSEAVLISLLVIRKVSRIRSMMSPASP